MELEKSEWKYDVIVGDLSDPREGGPCNHLYFKSFYESVIKPKLNENGIFVTQVFSFLSSQSFSFFNNRGVRGQFARILTNLNEIHAMSDQYRYRITFELYRIC